jgi:hypothetical protein
VDNVQQESDLLLSRSGWRDTKEPNRSFGWSLNKDQQSRKSKETKQ